MSLDPVGVERKPILWRLMQPYLHDLSEFDGSDVDEAGEYHYALFEHYWDVSLYPSELRDAFFIRFEGKLAGFALVRHMNNGRNQLAEFCILRKYRRRGIGRTAAQAVLRRFPGPWDLTIHPKNTPALAFWPKVIEGAASGEWTESSGPIIVIHRFEIG